MHKAEYKAIHKDCFEHLCPDYGDNPAITLKDLSQDKLDANKNIVGMTVHVYDTQFLEYHTTFTRHNRSQVKAGFLSVLSHGLERPSQGIC